MEIDWKVVLRKIKNYSLIIIAIALVLFALWFYHMENKNILPYNEYPDGSVLVVKNTYVYPYKTIIVIYKDGTVKKSKIQDKVLDTGKPQEHYKKEKDLTKEEVKELEHLIREVANHPIEKPIEEFYGILIRINSDNNLESAANYERAYVDELNDFIEEITKN